MRSKYLNIGKRTQERARRTLPGELCAMLDNLLYCGDTNDSRWTTVKTLPRSRANSDHADLKHLRDDKGNVETAKLLREIAEYLEGKSFSEVIE